MFWYTHSGNIGSTLLDVDPAQCYNTELIVHPLQLAI